MGQLKLQTYWQTRRLLDLKAFTIVTLKYLIADGIAMDENRDDASASAVLHSEGSSFELVDPNV